MVLDKFDYICFFNFSHREGFSPFGKVVSYWKYKLMSFKWWTSNWADDIHISSFKCVSANRIVQVFWWLVYEVGMHLANMATFCIIHALVIISSQKYPSLLYDPIVLDLAGGLCMFCVVSFTTLLAFFLKYSRVRYHHMTFGIMYAILHQSSTCIISF